MTQEHDDGGGYVLDHVVYHKCRLCHLFVEDNPSYGDAPGLARYMHLHRDDAADRLIDESHNPEPGESATLLWWKVYGPPQMRARFERPYDGPPEPPTMHAILSKEGVAMNEAVLCEKHYWSGDGVDDARVNAEAADDYGTSEFVKTVQHDDLVCNTCAAIAYVEREIARETEN